MEIRNNFSDNMESNSDCTTTKTQSPKQPPSPCDSEISVGCEAEDTSPMDTVQNADDRPNSQSSFSRDELSPRTMSPESPRCSDSYSYLSEDEYFRPLKRLAMSDASPNGGPHPAIPFISDQCSRDASCHSEEESDTIPSGNISDEVKDVRSDEVPTIREPDGLIDKANSAGLRSFSIMDILSYKPSRRKSSIPVKIVRPWDSMARGSDIPAPKRLHESPRVHKRSAADRAKGGALDALFKMTNNTLDNLNKEDKADAVNLFNNRAPSKKKRKSRTAFTNTQIFELEKRFLYQKYLSPADRDELAQTLGLSNAQVITWFQNRRAKLKRDLEEMKRDVQQTSTVIQCNKAFMEASANVMAFIKSKDLPKIPIPTHPH